MIRRALWRLLLEEGGWSRIWYGLATAMVIAGGGLIYHQTQNGGNGACTFPTCFPSAATTGVPSGTSLTNYTGPSDITTDDTVIDSKNIGCIQIDAANVIIRKSHISCGGAGLAVNVLDNAANYTRSSNGTVPVVTIEDSEIDCQNTGGTAVSEAHVKLLRDEITLCENGLDMNQNILVEDSFIHNLYNSAESHTDGAQFASGHYNGQTGATNITFRHNTIYGMGNNDTESGTSAIISGRFGQDSNVIIEQNLMAGGAATLYCEQNGAAYSGTSGVFNNRFSTIFSPTVGFPFASDSCFDENQSGNVYYETGLPITLD